MNEYENLRFIFQTTHNKMEFEIKKTTNVKRFEKSLNRC